MENGTMQNHYFTFPFDDDNVRATATRKIEFGIIVWYKHMYKILCRNIFFSLWNYEHGNGI